MQFRKFDRLVFFILLVLVGIGYGVYYWTSRENSVRSANKAKNIFYSTAISDTIKRIDPIYKDDCNTGFWITNYPTDYVVVDLCKFPELRDIKVGNVIRKEKNSTDCTIVGTDGKQTRINLRIEY